MAAIATLNVRMPEVLKAQGDKVLARKGITVSEAVRALYAYLEQEQELPSFIQKEEKPAEDDSIAHKRAMLASWVGITPEPIDIDAVRLERLEYRTRPGTRQ